MNTATLATLSAASIELDTEAEDFDADAALADMKAVMPDSDTATIDG